MATVKKSATTSGTRKTTTKKSAPKRAPAKATSTAKATHTSATKATATPVRSFRPHRTSSEAFFTFRITHQTLYWLILAGIVLLLGIWVTSISIKVQTIYDQIDATERATENMPVAPRVHN